MPLPTYLSQSLLAALIAGLTLQLDFALGAVGILSPRQLSLWWVHIVALTVSIIFAGLAIRRDLSFHRLPTITVVGSVILFTLAMVLGFLPIISRDALIYHLFIPKIWLEQGDYSVIPWHQTSYFPLLLSLGFRGFIALGIDFLVAPYQALFLLLTATCAYWFVRLVFKAERTEAACAVMVVLITPITLRLAGEPMTDGALSFFFGMGLLVFCLRYTHPNRYFLLLSGCFFGLSLSLKYTALLAFALLPLLLIWLELSNKSPIRRALFSVLFVLSISICCASPWYIRNYLLNGDPIFPFLAETIGTSAKRAFIGNMSPLNYRHSIYGETWLDLILLPVRVLFLGKDGSTESFDGQGTILYFAAIATLLSTKLRSLLTVIPIISFITLHLILAPFHHHLLLRYHATLLAPGAALAGVGLLYLLNRGRAIRIASQTAIGFQILLSCYYLLGLYEKRDPLTFLSDWQTTDLAIAKHNYLARHLTEFRLAEFVNEKLTSNECVYLLFTGSRLYYYQRCARTEYEAFEPFARYLIQPEGGNKLLQYLKAQGLSHLALHTTRMNSTLATLFKEEPQAQGEWQSFLSHTKAVPATKWLSPFVVLQLS